jgi:general secretion pathway protein J
LNLAARPPSLHPANGFTLLELLVSIALFSLLLTALLTGVHMGSRAWEVGEEQSRSNNDMRLAQELIRRHLSAAIPLFVQAGSQTELVFAGEDKRLSFATEITPRFGPTGVYVWEIGRGEGEAEGELYLRGKLFDPRSQDSEPSIVQSLAEDVTELAFDYFGAEGREPPRWHEEWRVGNRLPTLVRLRLGDRGGCGAGDGGANPHRCGAPRAPRSGRAGG